MSKRFINLPKKLIDVSLVLRNTFNKLVILVDKVVNLSDGISQSYTRAAIHLTS
jgi:hypothetical protein